MWLITAEAIPSNSRKSECEFEDTRLPYHGSVFIEKQGPVHVFLNYMGIVISASGEAFEIDFDIKTNQYIEQSGGASLDAELSKPSNVSEIDLTRTIAFWSRHNCIKMAPVGKELEEIFREGKTVWIPSEIISIPIEGPQFNPPYMARSW